jgi:hypothetical protein
MADTLIAFSMFHLVGFLPVVKRTASFLKRTPLAVEPSKKINVE